MFTKTTGSVLRKAWRPRIGKHGLLLLSLFALMLVWPHRTRSQTPTTGTAAQTLPQRVVYGEAFKHIVFLDDQANLADQQGQSGNAMRNYYQTRAGLSAAETALLKSTAHSTVTALLAVDQQIQAAVATYRAQIPNGKWPAKTPLPPLPAELQTLQTQKDNLILNGLAAIQAGYAAASFQNLDSFAQNDIAPHIALSVKQPPPPAKGVTLPPLQPIPWQ